MTAAGEGHEHVDEETGTKDGEGFSASDGSHRTIAPEIRAFGIPRGWQCPITPTARQARGCRPPRLRCPDGVGFDGQRTRMATLPHHSAKSRGGHRLSRRRMYVLGLDQFTA